MDIHQPKPWHGARELLKEVGTIVIGVLIALGAEQAVEWLHWRQQLEQTRDALREEIGDSLVNAVERQAVTPCLQGQLSGLLTSLIASAPGWKAPPSPSGRSPASPPSLYGPPRRLWKTASWTNAISSGVLNHMPRPEAQAFAALYDQIVELRAQQDKEEELATQLTPLGYDGVIGATERRPFIATVGGIYRHSRWMALGAGQLRTNAAAMHIRPPLPDVRSVLDAQRSKWGACVVPPPDLDLKAAP
jgi:hypothetical protein